MFEVKLKPIGLEKSVTFSERFDGKAVLVVNTASECGFTRQYSGLQALHEQYFDHQFEVAGFPSNDFGKQEPGSDQEIEAFCQTSFGVSFPMFTKDSVTGPDSQLLFKTLAKLTGQEPNWNFCKYLISGDRKSVRFFPSSTAPESKELRLAIEGILEGEALDAMT